MNHDSQAVDISKPQIWFKCYLSSVLKYTYRKY